MVAFRCFDNMQIAVIFASVILTALTVAVQAWLLITSLRLPVELTGSPLILVNSIRSVFFPDSSFI